MSVFELFADLTATTFENRGRKVTESISQHNGLLRELKKRGSFKEKDGGTEIHMPVMLEENKTIQNVEPGMRHSTAAGRTIDNAKYPWALKAMTVTANGFELRTNASKEKIIDLVNARVEQAEITAANRIAIELYHDGTLARALLGLKAQIADTGLGTVGTINSANYSAWQNKFLSAAVASVTPQTIRRYYSQLELKTTFGARATDLIVASHDQYLTYEDAVVQQIRYMNKDQAEGSVTSIYHKHIPIIHDINVDFADTANRAWFLNLAGWEIWVHPKAKFEQEDKRVPVDQDMVVLPYYWQGGLGLKDRRTQGTFFTF